MAKLVERGFFKFPPIKMSAPATPAGVLEAQNKNPDVQVLRVGKFNHPKYGEFEITAETLSELKANFDNGIRGVDVAFDYFHESDKEASGWPTELYLSEDGMELWAKVEWTPAARQKLAEREIRYFSPDFAFVWEDPETGVSYNNVLFGGGLTNRPFVKDMAAIVASEERAQEMKLEEMEKLVLKLSDDDKLKDAAMAKMQAEHADMKKKLADLAPAAPAKDGDDDDDADDDDESVPALKAKLAEAEKKCAEYAEKEKAALAEKQMAEKKSAFDLLLSEGKACAAQKDSFLKGDMSEFIKLAQPLNLEGKGHGGGTTDGGNSDRDSQVLKLAEKIAKEEKITLVDAITRANKEIKK